MFSSDADVTILTDEQITVDTHAAFVRLAYIASSDLLIDMTSSPTHVSHYHIRTAFPIR